MNVLAMNGFVKSLAQETIANKIIWKSLNELNEINEESNRSLYFTLFQTEFHSIVFLKSFYSLVPSCGYVYLIHETFESGYDGSVVSGPNIYIQKDASSSIHQLIVDIGVVYQLENAILTARSETDNEIQSFIDNFYNQK